MSELRGISFTPVSHVAGEKAEAQRREGIPSGPHSEGLSGTEASLRCLLRQLISFGRLLGDGASQDN